jgi:hypothetical protein
MSYISNGSSFPIKMEVEREVGYPKPIDCKYNILIIKHFKKKKLLALKAKSKPVRIKKTDKNYKVTQIGYIVLVASILVQQTFRQLSSFWISISTPLNFLKK